MKRTSKVTLPEPKSVPIPFGLASAMEKDVRAFSFGDCIVFVGSTEHDGWHMSISCSDRYPTWDEIAHARYTLLSDDLNMVMMLPPHNEYVNLHNNTFHLYEAPKSFK